VTSQDRWELTMNLQELANIFYKNGFVLWGNDGNTYILKGELHFRHKSLLDLPQTYGSVYATTDKIGVNGQKDGGHIDYMIDTFGIAFDKDSSGKEYNAKYTGKNFERLISKMRAAGTARK
jgi:hypothetical protein